MQETTTEINSSNILESELNAFETRPQPSPNNPPWNSFTAFLLWFASVGLIFILPALFLLPYLAANNISFAGNPDLASAVSGDKTAVLLMLGSTMFAHILTLVLAWVIVTKGRTYSFTEMLGWKWGGFKFWHGAVILVGIYAVALSLIALLGSVENEMTRVLRSSRAAVFMVAILATFSAPVVEEVVYRGVLYSAFQRTFKTPIRRLFYFFEFFPVVGGAVTRLKVLPSFKSLVRNLESFQQRYGIHLAVAFVTLVFAGVHVPQYVPDYATIISICLVSLVITLIRVRTGNLLPCIVFHCIFNSIQSILLIAEPYINDPK
ncbi:MAG: CPBP family intramembrane metalloprotease [Pyrinomonadaceae bacterium]|nr:CPBP family intramembrane metalloprotease [Pyrinomonadaceae bacterium]